MFSQRRGKNISSRGPPFSRSNPFSSFLGRMESRSKESYITVIRKSGQDSVKFAKPFQFSWPKQINSEVCAKERNIVSCSTTTI